MQTAFHRAEIEQPSWLQFAYVVGYDEGDGGGSGEGSKDTEGEEGGEEGGEEDESKLPENIKQILAKERRLRADAEKKAKILERNAQAAKSAGKTGEPKAGDKTGDEGAPKTDSGTQTKLERLIAGFRNTSLQQTVAGIATNFADPSDVYKFLDISAFDYTQDEDDPTNVVWDEAEIRAAIKALAKQKPYLLKPAADASGGTKKPTSGPKFAGAGSGRQTGGLSRTEMAQRIPALRTAVRAGTQQKNE